MTLRSVFSFPDTVDEISARLVATGVVCMGAAVLAGQTWVLIPLTFGFLARVLTGPTLSPLGTLVTKVVRPLLPIEPRTTAGPPKRFAQSIGLVFSGSASLAAFAFDSVGFAQVVIAMLVVAASLEAFVGFCLGCRIFAGLMRVGVIPEEVCEECNDIWSRPVPA